MEISEQCTELWAPEVEFLISLARGANRGDLTEKLANYYVRKFSLNRYAQGNPGRSSATVRLAICGGWREAVEARLGKTTRR